MIDAIKRALKDWDEDRKPLGRTFDELKEWLAALVAYYEAAEAKHPNHTPRCRCANCEDLAAARRKLEVK